MNRTRMDKLDKILKEIEHEMNEIKKLPPEERLKRIAKLEKMREEELRKAELLKQLSFQEINQDKQDEEEKELTAIQQEERGRKQRETAQSLEEEIEKQSAEHAANAGREKNRQQESNPGIYRVVSGEEIYGGIKNLRDRASQGNLTEEDLSRIDSYRSLIENRDDIYRRGEKETDGFMKEIHKAEYALKQIEAYRTGKKQNPNANDNYQK